MMTLQHALVELESCGYDIEKFEEIVAYALLPDAIRVWTGPRQYSHFEKCPDGDVSWMTFPVDVKSMTRDTVFVDRHLADGIRPCAVGEETSLDEFDRRNSGRLPEIEYLGVLDHLVQDCAFDGFVRERIDVSARYDDVFTYEKDGEIVEVDGAGCRALIAGMERHGFLVAAGRAWEKAGIECGQGFFDRHVKTALERCLPGELAASAYSYMKVSADIERKIAGRDFSTTGGFVSDDELNAMYGEVLAAMAAERAKRTSY